MGSLLVEVDRFGGAVQGRFAPAGAGRLRRSWRRPDGPVVGDGRSGRRNGARGRTKERRLTKSGERRLVGQGGVRPSGVVQRDDGTPTIPPLGMSERFSIAGIPGRVEVFASVR